MRRANARRAVRISVSPRDLKGRRQYLMRALEAVPAIRL
jgi:hypothetical protein